ncbi:hypothetical protein KDL01_07835 [Actinospica durhamensis]|uniref:Uncharacterized protein n=1 Tax=Actinospica durhamensis TaxID=1508375 RepID=A0A941ELK8_9ACTN|nr:hypothetical protein [Actinospica durhamensis]MBR7833170.1 hypothetical protein [Actinospica durhamensis]
MRGTRAVAATVFATAAAFTAGTGASQAQAAQPASRIYIPWTDQTVFALSPTDSYVAEWMGLSSGWTVIGGPASHVYAGSAGVFATDPTSGDIFEYSGTPGSWTEIGGPGQEFAEGGGHLYGLGPNGAYVAEWNGTPNSWSVIGGSAQNIYAGTDGVIATAQSTNSSGDVWHYNGTPGSWTDIGGHGWDFAVGNGVIYRADDDLDTVSAWTGGTTWTPILNTGNAEILNLVGGDQGVYVYDYSTAGNLVYAYSGTPNSWSLISTNGPVPETESETSMYGVVYGPNGPASVDQYSGSGSTWTVIGGPADPNLAAGD